MFYKLHADLEESSLSGLTEVSKNSPRALARGEFLFTEARPGSQLT